MTQITIMVEVSRLCNQLRKMTTGVDRRTVSDEPPHTKKPKNTAFD